MAAVIRRSCTVLGGLLVARLAAADAPFAREYEPNDLPAQATPLRSDGSTPVAVGRGSLVSGDVDVWYFAAAAGDRVYAAVQTDFSADPNGGVSGGVLELLASDGTTVLETDDDDGSYGAGAPSIAGAVVPADGVYYLRYGGSMAAMNINPYHLHLRVTRGAPSAEAEPPSGSESQTLPGGGWVSGEVTAADHDFFSFFAVAGTTIFVSLDLDPDRNGGWDGKLSFVPSFPLGTPALVTDNTSAAAATSEAAFYVVRFTSTYHVGVTADAAGGGGIYHLSVGTLPSRPQSCTTYNSSDVPVAIPGAIGTFTSDLEVDLTPGGTRIADLDVSVSLTHSRPADLDVSLRSPEGNEVGLWTDEGIATGGTARTVSVVLDDESVTQLHAGELQNFVFQPDAPYSLAWFDGEDPSGTWTLVVRDDGNTEGGSLNSWGIRLCTEPDPVVVCDLLGFTTPLIENFNFDGGGFSGIGDWQWGLPTAEPVDGCNEGAGCWKTNLDGGYTTSSAHFLVSPMVTLPFTRDSLVLTWAQKLQLNQATRDGAAPARDEAYLEVQQFVGGIPVGSRRVWEWEGGRMETQLGNPLVTIEESAGWGRHFADISDFEEKTIRLVFTLLAGTESFGGWGVDSVAINEGGTCLHTTPSPCRILDTREPGWGGPLASGVQRTIDLRNACSIPITAKALSLNVTVVDPTGAGHVTLFPGPTVPATSTINFAAGQTRANNTVIAPGLLAGTLRALASVTGGGQVHLILDVNGYFE